MGKLETRYYDELHSIKQAIVLSQVLNNLLKLILPSESPLNALYVLKMSMNSPIDILKDFFYSMKSVKPKNYPSTILSILLGKDKLKCPSVD